MIKLKENKIIPIAISSVTMGLLIAGVWYWREHKNKTSPPTNQTAEMAQVAKALPREKTSITLLGDTFSGYSTFRTAEFRSSLYQMGIDLKYQDEFNQIRRAEQLNQNDADIYVTTLDQFLLHKPQGKIVGLIDRTVGADAVVLNTKKYPFLKSVQDLGKLEYCPLNSDRNPIPIFTGKNPSYLDESGKPHLINHQAYQTRLPSKKELKRWFAHLSNGIGTLGSDRVYWIDLDVKQFASQEECAIAFNLLLERQPKLKETLLEKTHSGGYRIGVKVTQRVEFTNFCLEPGSVHVGECLGAGRFTVLAPTVGVSGKAYESINCPERLVEIEQIDFIYTVKSKSEKIFQTTEVPPLLKTTYSIKGTIALEELGHSDSQKVLAGVDIKSDRSESLTTALREWAGWSNWCQANGVPITGSVEELARDAGERLGIESDRVRRILNSIELDGCQPAAQMRGGNESCWRKVRRIERENHATNYPDSSQKDRGGSLPPNRGGNGDGGANNGGGDDEGYLPERNNWNAPVSWNGELGYWTIHKRPKLDPETGELTKESELVREFAPKCNFDLEIERELSDAEGGGLLLQVKRSVDNRQKRVIIRSLESLAVKDFALALTKTYGKGIVCNLKNDQLGALLHTKLVAYRERGGETYLLADRIGFQESRTWVFKDCQFTRTGEPTSEEKSQIVFNPNLGSEDKIFSPAIASPDPQALTRLVRAAHRFHGDSQIDAAIFTLGWAAACLHFQEIMKVEKHFPLLNLYGDPGSCKTVMAESALSLAGWLGGEGQFRKITESALYEHLKLCGSLPLCFDDPDKSPWLDGLIQGLYNAKPRVVRGNEQTPHTSLMLTTNHLVGDNKPSTLSRLIGVATFASPDGDSMAWDELVEAQKGASGALPQLIALGYPAAEVRKLSTELRSHLPHAHVRVADSIALVLWYASAVCRLSGFDEERIKRYAIANLCKLANDADSASDSLTDFLDKLSALHAQSLVGEWDCRVVKTREGFEGLALNMPSVWGKVDKVYNPPYSRRLIESQISASGGVLKSVQKFFRSEDEVKAYRRALVAGGNQGDNYVPPSPPEELARKCVMIPIHLVKDFLAAWKHDDSTVQVTPQLPDVTHELSTKGNGSNPHLVKDLIDSNSSSYLSKKEITNLKEASENFKNLESSFDDDNCVSEIAPPYVEKVTELNEQAESIALVGGTDSYLNTSNEEAIADAKKVTNSNSDWGVTDNCPPVTNSVVSKNLSGDGSDGSDGSDRIFETLTKLVESTNENLDGSVSNQRDADRENPDSKTVQSIPSDGLQLSPTGESNPSPEVTETSSLVEQEAQTIDGDGFEVGDIVTDILSGWSGKIQAIDGEWIVFQCRERGVVKQLRDLMTKGSFATPTHHQSKILVEKQPLSSVSQPCDYQVGHYVWTRVSGQLEIGAVVAISDDQIQVRVGDRVWDVDRFDSYWICAAE
jgi:hypothetical protein